MGNIKWYKRDPDAALQGMFELTLEERGAYGTVIDLIYAKANQLPDDDRFLAGWLRCDLRVWRRIKTRLIDLGKIRCEDGFIKNRRSDSEVLNAIQRVVSASEAGRISANSKASKSYAKTNENNVEASTDVDDTPQRAFQLTTTTTTTRQKDKSFCSGRTARGTRLADDFVMPPDWLAWACEERDWSRRDASTEAASFADYWRAKSGKDATKVDWQATWRNWVRNSRRASSLDVGSRRSNPAMPDFC